MARITYQGEVRLELEESDEVVEAADDEPTRELA